MNKTQHKNISNKNSTLVVFIIRIIGIFLTVAQIFIDALNTGQKARK